MAICERFTTIDSYLPQNIALLNMFHSDHCTKLAIEGDVNSYQPKQFFR